MTIFTKADVKRAKVTQRAHHQWDFAPDWDAEVRATLDAAVSPELKALVEAAKILGLNPLNGRQWTAAVDATLRAALALARTLEEK